MNAMQFIAVYAQSMRLLAVLCLIFGLHTGFAQPASVLHALPKAQLMGSTRLTVFGFQIYDAKLWAEPGFPSEHYAQHPLALELTYLRDFSGATIAKRSVKEMRGVASVSDEKSQAWFTQLLAVLPDVKKGDRVLGLYHPQHGITLFHNSKAVGEIKDPELAQVFTGIWLSPRTSQPSMRRELIARAPQGLPEPSREPSTGSTKGDAKP